MGRKTVSNDAAAGLWGDPQLRLSRPFILLLNLHQQTLPSFKDPQGSQSSSVLLLHLGFLPFLPPVNAKQRWWSSQATRGDGKLTQIQHKCAVQCAAAADNEELALGLEGGRSSLESDCDEILVGNFHTGKTATSRKAAADCVGSRFRSLRCLCCRAWMEWDCTQGRVILRECRVFATLASPSPSSRLWWVSDICCWDLIQRRRLFRIWLFAFPKAVGRVYSEVHRPRLTNCLTTRGASWDCSLSAVQFENVYLEPGWILSKFCPYLSDRRPNCGVDTGLHGMDCGSVMKSTVDCNWGWGSRAIETPPAHSHNRFQVSKALCFLGLEFLPCVTHTRVWDYY